MDQYHFLSIRQMIFQLFIKMRILLDRVIHIMVIDFILLFTFIIIIVVIEVVKAVMVTKVVTIQFTSLMVKAIVHFMTIIIVDFIKLIQMGIIIKED